MIAESSMHYQMRRRMKDEKDCECGTVSVITPVLIDEVVEESTDVLN